MNEPAEYLILAYLRDGRFRCVSAALAVLHTTGHVASGRNRTVRRSDAVSPPSDGLERILWNSLHEQVAPGALAAHGPVDAALSELRYELQRRGLVHHLVPVRQWTPSRTQDSDSMLEEAMARCPWPLHRPEARTPVRDAVGLPVALYGTHALRVLLPEFARASGLLTKSSSDTSVIEENSRIDSGHYFPGI